MIGNFGSLADILGTVTVDNSFGFTDLTVDASADAVSHDFTLSSTAPHEHADRARAGRHHLHDGRRRAR